MPKKYVTPKNALKISLFNFQKIPETDIKFHDFPGSMNHGEETCPTYLLLNYQLF